MKDKYTHSIEDRLEEALIENKLLRDKIAALKSKERRKTVRTQRPVQQRKGKTVRWCHNCGAERRCANLFADSNNMLCWEPRTASPIA